VILRFASRPTLPAAFILALATCSCASSHNYVEPAGPRYAGCYAASPDTNAIRLVTFNIKLSKEIDKAIDLLKTDPRLAAADLVMLQEMDAAGVHQIAFALGMCYVYYPATQRSGGHDFGDAILSKWPIEDDRKIILPHNGRFGKTQRIAVTGIVTIRERKVRLYSLHLATWVEVSFKHRKEQAMTVVENARKGPDLVIVAGDMNSHDVGEVFVQSGYTWPTRDEARTVKNGKLDHIFLKGLRLRDSTSVGVVKDNHGASDHRPVWAVLAPPE
jgi:endonuclease/exonuclease/phosphatase family metal-dependent hydrolase